MGTHAEASSARCQGRTGRGRSPAAGPRAGARCTRGAPSGPQEPEPPLQPQPRPLSLAKVLTRVPTPTVCCLGKICRSDLSRDRFRSWNPLCHIPPRGAAWWCVVLRGAPLGWVGAGGP